MAWCVAYCDLPEDGFEEGVVCCEFFEYLIIVREVDENRDGML